MTGEEKISFRIEKVKPFTPILTPEERLAIAQAPASMSNRALARLYGVTRHGVRYWRDIERRKRLGEQRKGRAEYKKFLKSSAEPRKNRRGRPKHHKLNKYEQMIHDAIGAGVGVDELERKIDENLSGLVLERYAIEEKIKECKEAQKALFRYLDITPDIEGEILSEPDKLEYMSAREMKIRMSECGLTLKALAKALTGRYSERALKSYREGMSPVPRHVADILRGYPKKQILSAWE